MGLKFLRPSSINEGARVEKVSVYGLLVRVDDKFENSTIFSGILPERVLLETPSQRFLNQGHQTYNIL